ncbi:MAG: hypothetical protein PHY79_16485 [Anaerolineae bacterium]|nr:hypothetical protein [Anaerolineae bacterium]MDX9831664.1 hypothetical protein [Anaerolineae bacterium]
MARRWEYCLLACTPMTGLDDEGVRCAYQIIGPEGSTASELYVKESLPLVAIERLLNMLGADGWELVAYDTTTNRGVFKREKA